MSDSNSSQLRQAEAAKRRRFVPMGFVDLVVGIILLAIGLLLNTGVRSFAGVLTGVGILVIIIGIIMILIGLINPITPDLVNPTPQPEMEESSENAE